MTTATAQKERRIDKVVRIGSGQYGSVYCKIKFHNGRLSISGVEGPKRNGDCAGGCGQILDHIQVSAYALGWDAALLERFRETWHRWHLNDLRAGCEHQRQAWNTEKKIEVVSYGLTSEAYHQLRRLQQMVGRHVGCSEPIPELSAEDRALLALDDWFKVRHSPPDADDPLSGCYEVKNREKKSAGWVTQNKHPMGLLSRPCEVCGYKYGSAWLFEPVPGDVLDFLSALPDTDRTPAWV